MEACNCRFLGVQSGSGTATEPVGLGDEGLPRVSIVVPFFG